MRMCGSVRSLCAAWLFVRAALRTWRRSGRRELSMGGSTSKHRQRDEALSASGSEA